MSTMALNPSVSHTPSLRLTRRGRLVVFMTGLLLVLGLGVLWGSGSVASEQPGSDATVTVQVEPGDTLYDLAASVTTDGDVNATVEQIQQLNHLESSMVYAGQKLRVPVE
jgi:hypothetical protein